MAEIFDRQEKSEGEIPAEENRRRKAVTFANRNMKNKKYRFADRINRNVSVGIVGGNAVNTAVSEENHNPADSVNTAEHRVKSSKRTYSRDERTADISDNSRKYESETYRKAAYIREMIEQENSSSGYYDNYYSDEYDNKNTYNKSETERRIAESEKSKKAKRLTDSERSAISERRTISPEVAERMKKAAFIKAKLAQEKRSVKENVSAENSATVSENISVPKENTVVVSEDKINSERENIKSAERERQAISEKNTADVKISAEQSEQMKKAAYLKEKLEQEIRINQVRAGLSDGELNEVLNSVERSFSDVSEDKGAADSHDSDKAKSSNTYEGRFIGNSDIVNSEKSDEFRRNTAIKQAYEKVLVQRQMNIRNEMQKRNAEVQTAAAISADSKIREENKRNTDIAAGSKNNADTFIDSREEQENYYNNSYSEKYFADIPKENLSDISAKSFGEKTIANSDIHTDYEKHLTEQSEDRKSANVGDGLVSAGEFISEYADAVQSGDAARLAAKPVEYYLKNNAGKNLQGVSDTANTLNTVNNSDSVGSSVMDISAVLAINEAKKRFMNVLKGKDTEEQIQRVEHRKSKKYHYVDGDENGGRFADKIEELKKRSFKNKLAKERSEQARQREQENIRQKQTAIFLRHNRDNSAFLPNRVNVKKTYIQKGKKLLLVGGGLAAVIPIFIIIIVIAAIASFFGWLLPMDYSLAGDDEEISAETNADVIDGYCKLIKNYMDVSQAYYYLTYGDWYGGTYNYPAASGMDFTQFYKDYCKKITDEIRNFYQPYIDAASSPAEKNSLTLQMNQAIKDALKDAEKEAKEEYEKKLAAADDTMTAKESRQPYEVSDSGGSNGVSDSVEFTGKPIVGTNHFGNVEIRSDLSAEELLSYIALYKTLKSFDTTKSDDDSDDETVVNISPKDIMDFFEDTEYIPITTQITHNNSCDGKCKRRMKSGTDRSIEWEYYCDGDHDNLSGEIGKCLSADELLSKITELTDSEKYGMNEDSCKKMIEEYLEVIKKELDISEEDFRGFGAADNAKAKEFYEMLTDEDKGEIPNNFWEVDLPMDEESGDDE